MAFFINKINVYPLKYLQTYFITLYQQQICWHKPGNPYDGQ